MNYQEIFDSECKKVKNELDVAYKDFVEEFSELNYNPYKILDEVRKKVDNPLIVFRGKEPLFLINDGIQRSIQNTSPDLWITEFVSSEWDKIKKDLNEQKDSNTEYFDKLSEVEIIEMLARYRYINLYQFQSSGKKEKGNYNPEKRSNEMILNQRQILILFDLMRRTKVIDKTGIITNINLGNSLGLLTDFSNDTMSKKFAELTRYPSKDDIVKLYSAISVISEEIERL